MSQKDTTNDITYDTIYDISKLTDEEIYNILGVTPDIEDHILETVIKNKIEQYRKTDEDLFTFFSTVYDYFYLDTIETDPPQPTQSQQQQPTHQNTPIQEGFSNQVTPSILSNYNPATGSSQLQQQQQTQPASLQQIVQYKSDSLNPLLKETVTKIITINSFDRDNKVDVQTDFSLTLSETLNNIVSLKLYSVQIPYTWYTINTNIGSNYFVLQGVSPGIDDGNHNIIIDISSGNYTPITLTDAIQNSFNSAKSTYSDISFGYTAITYNTSTALTTFHFDITKQYTETDYYLAFPSDGWTNPNDVSSNSSLAGFLGFNYNEYSTFSLLSNQTELPTTNITGTNDASLSIYYLTDTNNFFTIIQYVPTTINNTFNYTNYVNSPTNDPTTKYIQSIQVKSSLNTNTYYTRNQLFQDIATQVINNKYLDADLSALTRNNQTNSLLANHDFSYFKLAVKLNAFTTQTYENQKCAIIFPDETAIRIPIWVGSNSCFHYDISINELNDIYSETTSNIDTFIIPSTPFIAFVCQKPGYRNANNNYKLSIDVPTNIAITFTQFQTAVNTIFQTTQTNSVTSFNSGGDFNIQNTYFGLDTSSNASFSIDINKNMTDNKYIMDISNAGNFLYNTLHILDNTNPVTVIDLSINNTFNTQFNIQGGYTPFGTNDISIPLATFYLKPDYIDITNGNVPNYITPPPMILTGPVNTTYYTIADLENGINTVFSNYRDEDNQTPLSGSSIRFTNNNNATANCVLNVNIDKVLTQGDYTMVLSDINNHNIDNVINYIETSTIDTSYNSTIWATNPAGGTKGFSFTDLSFNYGFIPLSQRQLTNSQTTFSGSQAIGTNIFVPTPTPDISNNPYKTFYIKPQTSGLTTPTNDNYIGYTLKNTQYDKNQLLQEINTFFDTNTFTKGSTITIVEQNGRQKIKVRLNVNKSFKSYDYNLVFYSPYSIRACDNYNVVKFTTWDTCLGWILGFKKNTYYPLASYWDNTSKTAKLTGDAVLSVFLYNSFIVVIDDFTHNHLNGGLVTISRGPQNYQDNTIPTLYSAVNQSVFSLQHNYSLNQEINAQTIAQNYYSPGIYLKDVFGIIPMDVSTLDNNQIFIQIASTLQDQRRIYFGPVNIYRMRIALYNDRGQVVDLNGADWSFQMIAEQLYCPTK